MLLLFLSLMGNSKENVDNKLSNACDESMEVSNNAVTCICNRISVSMVCVHDNNFDRAHGEPVSYSS